MIIIVSSKKFKKDKKKLVEPKDYLIGDATEEQESELHRLSGYFCLDGLNPPPKLTKILKSDSEEELDKDKVKKLKKKFFKGKGFKTSAMACVKGIIEAGRPLNVFIIVRNDVYKLFADKMKMKIQKMFDVDFEFIVTYDEVKENKKLLKKEFKEGKLKDLAKSLKKLEASLDSDD